MKQSVFIRYGIVGAILLFATAFILCLHFFFVPPVSAAGDTSLEGTDGNAIASVSITDLAELNSLPFVNYTPDEYLNPNFEIQGTPVDLREENEFAQRGTFIFVIRNVDPMAENFMELSEALDPYLQGDYYWHFTLYIPKIWSACNVYVKYVLTDRIGALSDYNFIEYSDYADQTLRHVNQTEPVFLDLSFYSRRQAIQPDPLYAATVVTIHYEAESGKLSGIEDIPLIGADAEVRQSVSLNQNLLMVVFLTAAFITAVFLFVCLLKKERVFLPHLLIVFGLFGVLFSAYILTTATSSPYLWKALLDFFVAFTLLCAVLSVRDQKLFPLWLATAIASGIYCLVIPVLHLLPLGFAAWGNSFTTAVNLIFSVLILLFVLWNTKSSQNDFFFLINPLLIGILGITFCLPFSKFFVFANPGFWISLFILVYTAVLGGKVFIHQEKRLLFLKNNLQAEVQIQTKELKILLKERDEIFRYVSHDMKKPLASMEHFLYVAKQKEQDTEQVKTLEIIGQKIHQLSKDFTELSTFSKNNFSPEDSKNFELNELFLRAREDFEPDCSANAIKLKVIPCKITVFGKYNNLYSVISNIILNAIEHSACKNLTISAQKKKNACVIAISDDGKGLSSSRDIFYPYYSESAEKNNSGLGLYLSKCFMHSMNGDLSYVQENGLLTFLITLPLA